METAKDAYNELAYYTLSHADPSFIHQHIVDAFAAQNADEHSKPISVAFALLGFLPRRQPMQSSSALLCGRRCSRDAVESEAY